MPGLAAHVLQMMHRLHRRHCSNGGGDDEGDGDGDDSMQSRRQKQQRRLISSSLMATAVGAQRSTHSPAATGCEATAWRPTRLDSAVAIGKGKSPPSHIVPK